MRFLQEITYEGGYAIFFLWILANRAGVPLPATPALLGAGVLAGGGEMRLSLIVLLAVAATLASDSLWFWLGRHYGHRILNILCRFSIEPDACARRAELFLLRHGVRSLLVAKFVPGMNRTMLPLTGTARTPFHRFLLWDLSGAILWAGVYAGLGFIFSDELQEAADRLIRIGGFFVLVGAAALLIAYMLVKLVHRQRMIKEAIERISTGELHSMLQDGRPVTVVDLRDAAELEADSRMIPGAVRLDAAQLEAEGDLFRNAAELVLYCT